MFSANADGDTFVVHSENLIVNLKMSPSLGCCMDFKDTNGLERSFGVEQFTIEPVCSASLFLIYFLLSHNS